MPGGPQYFGKDAIWPAPDDCLSSYSTSTSAWNSVSEALSAESSYNTHSSPYLGDSDDALQNYCESFASTIAVLAAHLRSPVEESYNAVRYHFPAIHLQTFSLAGKSSVLYRGMLLVGAHFSKLPQAKQYIRERMHPTKQELLQTYVSQLPDLLLLSGSQ
jgi:hypothetical protein